MGWEIVPHFICAGCGASAPPYGKGCACVWCYVCKRVIKEGELAFFSNRCRRWRCASCEDKGKLERRLVDDSAR